MYLAGGVFSRVGQDFSSFCSDPGTCFLPLLFPCVRECAFLPPFFPLFLLELRLVRVFCSCSFFFRHTRISEPFPRRKKQEERRENAFFRCGKSVSRTVLRRRAGSVPSSFLHFYILHRDGSCFPGGEMFLPVSPYWRGRAGEENGRKGKKRNSMTLQYRKSVRSQCTEGKGVFLLDPRRIL